ncbi:MAG: hypothetical protein HY527_06575 [Betaproteobacteria bacterium]|nr:hypothetical protein [Betaproteobacteria bacterium]
MNVELTPDQRAFVQKAIESGRFARQEEAVKEALALWEERERRRLGIIARLAIAPLCVAPVVPPAGFQAVHERRRTFKSRGWATTNATQRRPTYWWNCTIASVPNGRKLEIPTGQITKAMGDVLLAEPYFDLKTPNAIGRETGARVLVMTPSFSWRRERGNRLSDAVRSQH